LVHADKLVWVADISSLVNNHTAVVNAENPSLDTGLIDEGLCLLKDARQMGADSDSDWQVGFEDWCSPGLMTLVEYIVGKMPV
jgi:hypothetical protein